MEKLKMDRQVFEYHPRIGHRFIPHLKTRIKHEGGGYLLRTNNLGFRCEHDFEEKKGSKKRILVFGDSYTAGDGVPNKKRFTDILEESIPNTEVYNFGMSATGTDQQYIIYQEFARTIEADLIVIVVLAENILRVNSSYKAFVSGEGERVFYQKPYYKIHPTKGLELFNSPPAKETFYIDDLKELGEEESKLEGRFHQLKKIVAKTSFKGLVQKVTRYQPLPQYDNPLNPEWLLMRRILKQWVRELDTKVLLVPLPIYQHIEQTSSSKKFISRFEELSQDLNIEIHNLLPDLFHYSTEERRKFRFEVDVHPTASGHQAIAESLKPIINNIVD